MLKKEQLRCGVYDSLVSQKNKTRTPVRDVVRYELELYAGETGVSYIDGEAYSVRRGMLLCAKPGQQRYSQLPIRSSYIWVEKNADVAWVLEKFPACTYIDDGETVEMLLRLFTRLHSATTDNISEPEYTVTCNCLLLEILQLCLQQYRGGDKRQMVSHCIREAYRYMDKHFTESCLLSEVADYVHLSANHLHTVFLGSEGYTPYEYVTRKRIEKAKTMILMGEHSLAQIALETGFCSQSHFTAVFKKATGQTPAGYRRQLFDMK